MAEISGPVPEAAAAGYKFAQLFALVKDNQLVTALVVFVLWQSGAIGQVSTLTGCF